MIFLRNNYVAYGTTVPCPNITTFFIFLLTVFIFDERSSNYVLRHFSFFLNKKLAFRYSFVIPSAHIMHVGKLVHSSKIFIIRPDSSGIRLIITGIGTSTCSVILL